MKITRMSVYQADVPLTEPEDFKLSRGRSYRTMDVTFVRLDTDEGISGWGEVLTWAPDYTMAHPGAARAGLEVLGKYIPGMNPLHHKAVNHLMDKVMVGNEFAKSPIDMACWDIHGKHAGVPLYELLGGKLTEHPHVYAFIQRAPGDEMVAQIEAHRKNGINHFGTKASDTPGGMIEYINILNQYLKPGESVCLDFNRGLRFDEALRLARGIGNADIIMEQPCESIEECRKVMEITGIPVMYDECVNSLRDLVKTLGDANCTYLNVKIGRAGGITKAMAWINFCEEYRIPVYVQDYGGTDITAAAVLHMAHATSPGILGSMWDTNTMIGVTTAEGVPPVVNGTMTATERPGLGVDPVLEVMGEPVMVYP
jgi:cis-L-3-hydroxyproline dehydratase